MVDYRDDKRFLCATCGFLAKHTFSDRSPVKYFEAESDSRILGSVFTHTGDVLLGSVNTLPVCFRNAARLWNEATWNDTPEHRELAKGIFAQDRAETCAEEWIAYQPGLNPAMHLARRDMERLEEARRAWQKDLENDRREWLKQFHGEMETNRSIEGGRWNLRFFSLGALQVGLAIVGIWVTVHFAAPQPIPSIPVLIERTATPQSSLAP